MHADSACWLQNTQRDCSFVGNQRTHWFTLLRHFWAALVLSDATSVSASWGLFPSRALLCLPFSTISTSLNHTSKKQTNSRQLFKPRELHPTLLTFPKKWRNTYWIATTSLRLRNQTCRRRNETGSCHWRTKWEITSRPQPPHPKAESTQSRTRRSTPTNAGGRQNTSWKPQPRRWRCSTNRILPIAVERRKRKWSQIEYFSHAIWIKSLFPKAI